LTILQKTVFLIHSQIKQTDKTQST